MSPATAPTALPEEDGMTPHGKLASLVLALSLATLACSVFSSSGGAGESGPSPVSEDALRLPEDAEPEFGGGEIEIVQTRRASFAITDIEARDRQNPWDLITVKAVTAATHRQPEFVTISGPECDFDTLATLVDVIDIEITNSDSEDHEVSVLVSGEAADFDLQQVQSNPFSLDPGETRVVDLQLRSAGWATCDETHTDISIVSVDIGEVDGRSRDEAADYLRLQDRSYARWFDIWLLSNPTDQALPIYWENRQRDAQGLLVGQGDDETCTRRSGSPVRGFYALPPGQSIILPLELTVEEVEAGITQELIVRPITDCFAASYFGIGHDPLVVLQDLEQHGDMLSVVFANNGQGEGWGALYVNIFDAEGEPVYGYSLGPLDRTIPPGERASTNVELKASWLLSSEEMRVEPSDLRFEFVWLGLSE